MSDISHEQLKMPTDKNLNESHYWVSAHPFAETSLYLIPSPLTVAKASSFQTEIIVYDADGGLANKLTVEYPTNQAGILEITHIIGASKLESGFRYAHIVVLTEAGVSNYCRIHSRDGACLIAPTISVAENSGSFFPITLSHETNNFLAITNSSKDVASLKCRLFLGKRTPETVITIPGLGARVLSIESVFAEYTHVPADKTLPGYLKLSTKNSDTVGVQLIERAIGRGEGGLFSAIS